MGTSSYVCVFCFSSFQPLGGVRVCVCASTSEHDIIATSRHNSILFASSCGLYPAPTSTQSRIFSSILSKQRFCFCSLRYHCKAFFQLLLLHVILWSSYLAANNTHCFLYCHFIDDMRVCVCCLIRELTFIWILTHTVTHFRTSSYLSVSPYSSITGSVKKREAVWYDSRHIMCQIVVRMCTSFQIWWLSLYCWFWIKWDTVYRHCDSEGFFPEQL